MPLYLKVPSIEGNVSTSNYKGWIELNSLDLNMKHSIQSRMGQADSRVAGMPRFSEAEISKNADNASNNLFQNACTATVMPEVEIHSCDSQTQTTTKYVFSGVIVSSASHSVPKNDKGQELLTLNYRKVQITYIGKDASGNQKSPHTVGYNLDTVSSM